MSQASKIGKRPIKELFHFKSGQLNLLIGDKPQGTLLTEDELSKEALDPAALEEYQFYELWVHADKRRWTWNK